MSKNTSPSSLFPFKLPPIVKHRVVEIPKPTTIVEHEEVPHTQYIERIEEVPVPRSVTRWIPTPKIEVTERTIQIPKPVIEEKIVEVPQIQCVEKIVEVPQYIYQERIIEVPKVTLQERIIPVPKRIIEEKIVEVSEDELEAIIQSTERLRSLKKSRPTRYDTHDDEVDQWGEEEENFQPVKTPRVPFYSPNDQTEFRGPPTPPPPPPTNQRINVDSTEPPSPIYNFYEPNSNYYSQKCGDSASKQIRQDRDFYWRPNLNVSEDYYPSPSEYYDEVPPLQCTDSEMYDQTSSEYISEFGTEVPRPLYRWIPRAVEVPIYQYRPYPVERIVNREIPVPVEVQVEEDVLIPRINKRYVEVPIKVPFYGGTATPLPHHPHLPVIPPHFFPLVSSRYVKNRPSRAKTTTGCPLKN